ncbi:hypothetical protein HMPREF6485_2559 [Segatella buccae ATCC 33574]|uniref:Uncharacterized protein n=1 Tax=Segatella buccae ATCC 33574 TaxID=873513 RepID=E6KAC3_9BACT|nr:hypothetical protein HMPREF6485_2559 [Segatella buccae ATCC 33574]
MGATECTKKQGAGSRNVSIWEQNRAILDIPFRQRIKRETVRENGERKFPSCYTLKRKSLITSIDVE